MVKHHNHIRAWWSQEQTCISSGKWTVCTSHYGRSLLCSLDLHPWKCAFTSEDTSFSSYYNIRQVMWVYGKYLLNTERTSRDVCCSIKLPISWCLSLPTGNHKTTSKGMNLSTHAHTHTRTVPTASIHMKSIKCNSIHSPPKTLMKFDSITAIPQHMQLVTVSYSSGLSSIPGRFIWDLWWTKGALGQVLSEHFSFPCQLMTEQ